MQPSPLYRGELVAVPTAHHTAAPEQSPFASLLAQGNAARTAQLDQLDAAILDNYEYGLEQNRAARARQIEADTRTSLIDKMSRNNGDPEGFFDANGIYQKEKAELFMQQQLSLLDGFDQGFISQNARRKAQEAHAQTRDALDVMMKSTILRSVQERATLAAKQNFDLAMAQRDYAGAAAAARDGGNTGAFSPQQAGILEAKANDALTEQNIYNIADTNPAKLNAIITDPDTPQQFKNLARRLAEEKRDQFNAVTIQPETMEQSASSSRKKSAADNIAHIQSAVPQPVYDLWEKHKGVFKDNPEALKEAVDLAPEVATLMIYRPGDPRQEQHFKETFKALGVSESYLNDIIKTRQENLSAAAVVNTRKLYDNLPRVKNLTPQNEKFLAQAKQEYDKLEQQALADTQAGITQDPANREHLTLLKRRIDGFVQLAKESREKDYATINARYERWYAEEKAKRGGALIDPSIAANKFFNLADEYFKQNKSREAAFAEYATTEYTQTLAANKNRLAKEAAAGVRSVTSSLMKQGLKAAMSPAKNVAQNITREILFKNGQTHQLRLIYNELQDELPHFQDSARNIIYVPPGTKTTDRITLQTPGKKAVSVEVMESDKVTSPKLSGGLVFNLGDIEEVEQYNSITIYGNRAFIYASSANTLFPDDGVDPQGASDYEEATQVSDEYPLGIFPQNY